MAERDELGRTLALARESLRGPAAMKERVRAQLAAGELAARMPASPASTGWLAAGRRLLARRYHLVTVALLVGVGFGAGFWLGRVPREQPQGGRSEAALGSTHETPGTLAAQALLPAQSLSSAGTTDASSALPGSSPLAARAADGAPATSEASPRAAHGATSTSSTTSTTSTTSTRPPKPRRSEPRGPRAGSDDSLMREVALLERIDRAIRAGEGALSSALLAELDRSVPAPTLRHERDAARVLTRCLVARDRGASAQQQAVADADRFLARHRTSVYADRIRAACPLDGASSNRRAGIEEPFSAGH
jgi:hypothetical protein